MKDIKMEEKNKKTKKNHQTTQLNKKDKAVVLEKKKFNLKKYLNKVSITYLVLLLLDIILVIYAARLNVVNYAVVLDEEIFLSKTRYLLWGRNYVNVIIIFFFYIYTCLINRFFLKRKNTKKFLIWLLIGIIILNVLLFIIFTKKVY